MYHENMFVIQNVSHGKKQGEIMEEKKSTVYHLRMTQSLKDKVEERARGKGKLSADYLRELIERDLKPCVIQNVSQTDVRDTKCITSVTQNVSHEKNVSHEQEEIKSMCSFFELDERDFYGQIYRYFQSGEITIEEGKVILKPEGMLDTEAFVMACEEKYIDPKEAFEEAIKRVYSSQIGGAGGK